MARAVQDLQRAVAQLERRAVGQRPRDLHRRAPRAKARRHGAQRGDDFGRDAVAQHEALGKTVVEIGLLAVARQEGGQRIQRGHLGARASREDRGEAEVIHVLVGDHEQLDVLHAVPARGQRLLQFVHRLRRVGARVQQRQRRVLDQVGVHAPHLKGRWDRQAVDARLARRGQRLLGALRRLARGAHERISASTSSRRRAMSSAETSDSRHRRRSGSVFEGRTLKCQSSYSIEIPSRRLWRASA